MKCSYMIKEYNDEIIFENSSRKTFEVGEYETLDNIAEECAEYDYNNCDGWESVDEWRAGKTITLFDNKTKKIVGQFLVRLEFQELFYAETIGTKK